MRGMLKKAALWCGSLCLTGGLHAQADDPVVMKINGKDVLRSEFEYNFNKNGGENAMDRKTVDEYADLFVNYKLKVEAALDARCDTLPSFRKEFRDCRDRQILPYFVSPAAEEKELRHRYDRMKTSIGPDGLVRPAHIVISVAQKATAEEQEKAKERMDSIYAALRQGADFAALAMQCSSDKASAARGGDLGGWVAQGQTMKEFEDAAFSLRKGEMSEPFRTPMGYHVVLMKDRKQLEPYEELKPQLRRFLEDRGMKERVAAAAIDSLVGESGGLLTEEDVIRRKTEELCAKDRSLKYLIQEYHDGLLLYEICSREVWDKAANDTAGPEAYFKANKSKYKWDGSRYRGVVFHCKDKGLVRDVRKLLKSVDEALWIDSLRAAFNRDSAEQVRAEKGLFKKGDNAFVDCLAFKGKNAPEPLESYPYAAVYGKKLKRPERWTDVRGEVVSDYQVTCEERFVRKLRETYKVEIYKEVLNTVNKH